MNYNRFEVKRNKLRYYDLEPYKYTRSQKLVKEYDILNANETYWVYMVFKKPLAYHGNFGYINITTITGSEDHPIIIDKNPVFGRFYITSLAEKLEILVYRNK